MLAENIVLVTLSGLESPVLSVESPLIKIFLQLLSSVAILRTLLWWRPHSRPGTQGESWVALQALAMRGSDANVCIALCYDLLTVLISPLVILIWAIIIC